jgi:hypothetical protein
LEAIKYKFKTNSSVSIKRGGHTSYNHKSSVYSLLFLSAIVCLLCFLYMFNLQLGMAQNTSDIGMRSYKNAINISYPSGWIKEENISKYNIVAFLAPSINSSKIHPAAIAIYKQKLPISTNQANEESLFNMYSLGQINYINKHFNITSINKTQLSGSAAYQVVYNSNGKTISYTWTIKNYDVYGIILVSNNYNYAKYLPQLNKMKDSFRIPNMNMFQQMLRDPKLLKEFMHEMGLDQKK